MIKIDFMNFQTKKDLKFIMSAEQKNIEDIAEIMKISRTTIYEILNSNITIAKVYEKIYSSIYNLGYRLNSVKEDFIKETSKDKILFHGSKKGIDSITASGSRQNCDFGSGFYLGETYDQALSFVCENKDSSVYSFSLDINELNVIEFDCSLEWMLAICYYRGTINEFAKTEKIKNIINRIENADVIIAPIADNRMFYIMSLFASGDINSEVALHSLSASKLGKQYILKKDRAINKLNPIEKYYLCGEEKKDCIERLMKRTLEIETKLKLAKREFRNGLYIEELLK